MVNYELFGERMFDDKRIKWCNRLGYFQLDDNRVVELELHNSYTSGDYTGYTVTIVSKTGGVIRSNFFNFNNVMLERDRIDSRVTGNNKWIGQYHLSDHCLESQSLLLPLEHISDYWYIAVPSDKAVKRYRDAVMSYIESYT